MKTSKIDLLLNAVTIVFLAFLSSPQQTVLPMWLKRRTLVKHHPYLVLASLSSHSESHPDFIIDILKIMFFSIAHVQSPLLDAGTRSIQRCIIMKRSSHIKKRKIIDWQTAVRDVVGLKRF
ncbi:hypothetical protein Tco_0245550 [Tanacetum coccineum]